MIKGRRYYRMSELGMLKVQLIIRTFCYIYFQMAHQIAAKKKSRPWTLHSKNFGYKMNSIIRKKLAKILKKQNTNRK